MLAGPGTGKSYALIKRMTRLVTEGVGPERIMVVTFARAAAQDLRPRAFVGVGDSVEALSGCKAHQRLIGTAASASIVGIVTNQRSRSSHASVGFASGTGGSCAAMTPSPADASQLT